MFRVRVRIGWVTVAAALWLGACAPVTLPSSTPIPTQQMWEVTYPPETAWLVDSFDDCLEDDWNTGIVIQEVTDAQLATHTGAIQLVWGDVDPQGQSAYQLGTDTIRLVVHPDSPVRDISLEQLQAIYTGEIRNWDEVDAAATGELHGWIYPEYLTIQRVFLNSLGGTVSFSPYFNIAPDVKAMIEAVSADPLAVGYIPASWPRQALQEVNVTGWEVSSIPVVALVPQDDPRLSAWLSCLSGTFPGQ